MAAAMDRRLRSLTSNFLSFWFPEIWSVLFDSWFLTVRSTSENTLGGSLSIWAFLCDGDELAEQCACISMKTNHEE